jgi:hypothetical protein
MVAQTACNLLNTQQELEYIKELWQLVLRITYIVSKLHFIFKGTYSLPKPGSIYSNTLYSPNLPYPPTDIAPTILILHSPSHTIFQTYSALPATTGPLSCPLPAQSPNARSSLLPLLAFRSSCWFY